MSVRRRRQKANPRRSGRGSPRWTAEECACIHVLGQAAPPAPGVGRRVPCPLPRQHRPLRDWLAVPRRLARRSASSLPFPRALPPPPSSASTLLPHPRLSGAGLLARPQSARAPDVGAGQVHGASVQDGQPLHQHCGHWGLEPAERGHPGHARRGVRVLQVRTQPFPLPSAGWAALG